MSSTPTISTADRVTSCTLFAVAQTALGAGLGLMLSGRFSRSSRQVAAITAISVGVASAAPLIVRAFTRGFNSPRTARGMRRRLRSIREDAGFHSGAEFF